MKIRRPRFRPTRRSFLSSTGALAVGLTFLPRNTLSQEEQRLNFYNWDTYIGETTLEDFRAESGIDVQMDLYADNDELFAKLRAGNPGYDVIVPTNDYVERMITADMLMPLDHSRSPTWTTSTRRSATPPSIPAASTRSPTCGAPWASATARAGSRSRSTAGAW
jgi:spermidine/putrescine transport system substrate-binding protein